MASHSNVKIWRPSKDACNKRYLFKSHLIDDRINENTNSFQEDEQIESDSNSEAKTVEKEKRILVDLEHMQLHVAEVREAREFCKGENWK